VQDFAFAGQEVVLDAEAEHGFKMAAKDGGGDQVGDFGGFVAAVLDEVQRVEAELLARGLLFGSAFGVPLRGAGVEIPAVVVDALDLIAVCGLGRPHDSRSGDRRYGKLFNDLADFGSGFLLQVQESYDHIRDLDAGVVDVVLNVHFVSGGAKQAHEGVAENCIPQMPDVRGLVGINRGVLYEHMALRVRGDAFGLGHQASCGDAVEIGVDIPGAGHFEFGEAIDGAEGSDDLLSDDLWSLAEFAGQLEGDGRGDLAEAQIGRRLQRNLADFEIVFFFQDGAKATAKPLFQFENHARASKNP
jgi:hypothetical protein